MNRMVKDLNELVAKLRQALGVNLKSVVLYGSAVAGEFHPKHSDLNVLCALERLDATELQKLNPVSVWWARKGRPAPKVFTLEELRRSADVFAIELVDIQANHRVLFGEDFLAALTVPMTLHRAQVERELRTNLIRLRQSYLARKLEHKAIFGLMTSSISTFATLFRHALMTLGERSPERKREVFERLASILGFEASAFYTVLDVREGKRDERDVDVEATFRGYLAGVTHVAEEMDRRLVTQER
jgi:predicted nucleotidyltransferase